MSCNYLPVRHRYSALLYLLIVLLLWCVGAFVGGSCHDTEILFRTAVS